jgi:para-nitrobenzyl esterase
VALEYDDSRLRVQTTSGLVVGDKSGSVESFKGIPYAAAPVGDLRWQAPQSETHPDRLIDASRFGFICPQPISAECPEELMSEDCLNLNVWTGNTQSKQAVMVWIHGGGFRGGSNQIQGEVLAEQNVVVVALNYRLGAFGFFAHPFVQGPGFNFGLLDLIEGLKWIQKNILAFGGDPGRVTIFGISAGAAAVNLLMASDAARGLFHGAIAQSGYGTWPLLRSRLAQTPGPANLLMNAPDAAEYDADMIIQRTGQIGVDLKSLQAIPARQLVDAQTGFQLPIVDGSVVAEEPGIRFQAGKQHAIPYLSGGNSYEGTIMPSYQIDPEVYEKSWNLFDPQWPIAYQRDFLKSPKLARKRLFGDERYLLSALLLAESMGKVGSQSWLYFIDYLPPAMAGQMAGSPHGLDAWLLFSAAEQGDSESAELSHNLRNYWTNFAKFGDPDGCMDDRDGKTRQQRWQSYQETGEWKRFTNGDRVSALELKKRLAVALARYRARINPFSLQG